MFLVLLKFEFMKLGAVGIMGMSPIRLYDIFRKDLHLPDERAHLLVEAIDETVKDSHEANLKGIATIELVKEENRNMREFVGQEVGAARTDLQKEIGGVRTDLQREINTVRSDLQRVELKVEQTKSELSRTIFWTSLVQFLAIIGAIIGIISFMTRK